MQYFGGRGTATARTPTGWSDDPPVNTTLSVEDAPAWKPARAAYEYAARICGTELGDMLLVAAHPWDIDGATRAAWPPPGSTGPALPTPDVFTPPSLTAGNLTGVARQLAATQAS